MPAPATQIRTQVEPRLEEVQCISPLGLHRFAYAEWGDPKNPRVLVCAHGLTRSGRDFDPLARALCDEYRVVCPDVVGRGRSDWFANASHYHVPQYVADSVTLLARLDAEVVDWVGTSMGGLIGMGLASLKGSPIRKLVLNDIGPVLLRAAVARIADYVGKLQHFATFDDGVTYVRTVAATFGTHTDEEWRMLAGNVLVPDGSGFKLHYDPGIAMLFRTLVDNTPVHQNIVSWNEYDRVTCPTLAIRGETSDLLSPEVHMQMATRGPRATLATVRGVGHAPSLIAEDQIALVRDFLL